MMNKEKDAKPELLNNFYVIPNNIPKKKIETVKEKKRLTPKSASNFQKITGSGSINTSGSQPIVVYKKNTNKKIPNEIMTKSIPKPKNEYISDGGLNQKLQKYNNNSNNNLNNVYFNNFINEKSPQIPNNKNTKNNDNIQNTNITKKLKEQQQIFSKTVREFNKRPAIQKSEKSKETYNNTKNGLDGKKLKNKSVNQNLNSNTVNNTSSTKNNPQYKKSQSEDSKNQEEKKLILMKQLVENGVVNEIKKLQNKKKVTPKDIKDVRKREILENNGLPIDFPDDNNEEKKDSKKMITITKEENPKKPETNNNNVKNFMSKTTRGFYPKINNYMFSLEDNKDEKSIPLRTKKLKPSVNQFEYINRINNEKRKLNFRSQVKSVNVELNDSFRRKNYVKNNNNNNNNNLSENTKMKNQSYNNEINRRSIDDEFPFAHRTNHRTSEEIKRFVKAKRKKNKKKEDDILLEKNKKLFLLFKNLYNLNMKDISKPNPSMTAEHFFNKSPPQNTVSSKGKTIIPIKNSVNNNINKYEINNSNNNIRKKKEINEYYIGNESTIKNNNSTLVDPNEYYLNVLESQQLFVNSGLNRIENDSDTSEENENNSNDLNISKEQIQKIISKEINKLDSSSKKNNNIKLNTNEYDDLKKKFNNTLERVGKVFSKEDKDKGRQGPLENKTKNEISKNPEKKGEKSSEKKEIKKQEKSSEIKEEKSTEKKDKNKEKEKENNSSNKKNTIKSPEINIESSNAEKVNNNNTENNNTKEKNLPSLSHTYTTNTNPNKKVEIEIEPRAVLNLVEILKFIIQRKVFILLYESYINKAIFQQYNIAFAYFIAFCKQYPFRKIEEYCNYKTYKYAFRHLFKPFMRRAFRHFIKVCYSKKKIEYLFLFLNKFYKNKIYEKIINYAKNKNQKYKQNQQNIKPFITLLTKPYIRANFNELKNRLKPKEEKLDKKFKSNVNEIEEHINITKEEKPNIVKKDEIYNNVNKKNNPLIKKIENIELKNSEDESINISDSIRNHRRKNDNSIKMNSYLYESFGSDSKSFSLEPNSEDNDKLHQLKMMLLIKNNLENEENSRDIDINSNSNSLDSSSHKKYLNKNKINQQINNKINISDDDIKIEKNINNKLLQEKNNKINKLNDNNVNKNNNPLIKKIENIELKNSEDESINISDSIRNHRRKNDNSIKMNSYLYESFGSDSKSFSLEPNSEDNDKLHQLKMMLLIKNNLEYEDNSRDIDINSNTNSLDSSSHKKYLNKNKINQQINNKINISDDDIKIEKNINNKLLQEKINKINKLNDNNNEKSSIDVDVSADNDKSNEIEWGYNINSLNSKGDKDGKEETNNRFVKNEKHLENEDFLDDEYNDFEKGINSDNEEKQKEKEEEEKEDEKDLNLIKNEIKQDKSRNLKQDDNPIEINKSDEKSKDINNKIKKEKKIEKKEDEKDMIKEKEKEKEKEKIKEKDEEKQREIFSKKVKEIKEPEKIAEELTEEIMKKLLTTEIKSSKKKLIPTKKFKFDKFDKMNSQNNSLNNSYGSAGNTHDHLSREFGLSGLSQLSLADELLSLNDSIMSNYSAHSIFNKTVKDKKKEHTLSLYYHSIAPKLIKLIYKEIIDKYPLIYENISTPMKNNSEKLMMSLALQDADLLRNNYKTTKDLVSIAKILDKDKILKDFEPINKKIRSSDNVASDNFYDKMLNDCIVETAIEIINKERLYGKNGEPLKWSSRTHELAFKYKKDDPKKLANFVCKKLIFGIRNRVGLISDNYESMSPDQINFERDKRLTNIIKRDLDEYEYQWNNLEMEETQLKVDNAELIMEQLYNEVIEILEHIQYSRIRPDLYQNKSIYACEDIPKLDFQLTTTEEATMAEGNENNDIINV